MFAQLRYKLAHFLLNRRTTPRLRRVLGYADAKSVLLLIEVEKPKDIELVNSFAGTLKQKYNIAQVVKIAYVRQKKMLKEDLPFDFVFTAKDARVFSGLPKKEVMRLVANLKVDIAIDFTDDRAHFIKGVLAKVPAHFKVAKQQLAWKTLYDFFIELPAKSPKESLVEPLHHYLSLIHEK